MRILVLTNLYPPDVVGGYELGCRQVVDSLRAGGFDVRVATSVPRVPVPTMQHVRRVFQLSDNWSSYINGKRTSLQHVLHMAHSYRISGFNVYALLQQVEEFRPDVAYLWNLEGIGALGIVACLSHIGMPWVWHLMDRVPVMACSDEVGPVPTLVREYNGRIRGTYLACSQTLLDEIRACGILLKDTVELLPNWIAGPQGPPRESYLKDGCLRIMHAAAQLSTQADKGTDLVVEAVARLRAQGHDRVQLDLFGHVADRSIPDLILKHGLQHHVRLIGWRGQAELRALHADYDLFAFPTRAREPFGFSALEAAAAGCVPLLSYVCGISEWFVHGVHVLKTPREVDAIARVFAAILEGAVDLARIGRRSAAVVRREFHLDTIVPTIIASIRRASNRSLTSAGSPAEAYRLAVLAERLTQVSIQERAYA